MDERVRKKNREFVLLLHLLRRSALTYLCLPFAWDQYWYSTRETNFTQYINKNKICNRYDIRRQRVIRQIYQNNNHNSKTLRWGATKCKCSCIVVLVTCESTTVCLTVQKHCGLCAHLLYISLFIRVF